MELFKFLLRLLWKKPIRNILCGLFLFAPSVEIVYYLLHIFRGGAVYIPDFAFFFNREFGWSRTYVSSCVFMVYATCGHCDSG